MAEIDPKTEGDVSARLQALLNQTGQEDLMIREADRQFKARSLLENGGPLENQASINQDQFAIANCHNL